MEKQAPRQSMSFHSIISLAVAFVLFAVGFALLIGAFSLGNVDWWLSVLLILIGIFMLSSPGNNSNVSIGLLLASLGLFSLLRTMEIIETPWLRYGLGGFLVLTSVINIFRNVFGQATPINETWRRNDNDDKS